MRKVLEHNNQPQIMDKETRINEDIAENHPWVLDVLSICEECEIPKITIQRFAKYYLEKEQVS
ncbi:hypothetical protein [Bacillus alkalicellulosilyticus]|uniref:hypothetical protein n=1 Tax=Alkalihalobacterium alkalicellulosilyticum TaxID=1912214 RepID=UPI0009989918|nr:hypothetical protein [Bacillus alkalicellulosilyticus]